MLTEPPLVIVVDAVIPGKFAAFCEKVFTEERLARTVLLPWAAAQAVAVAGVLPTEGLIVTPELLN